MAQGAPRSRQIPVFQKSIINTLELTCESWTLYSSVCLCSFQVFCSWGPLRSHRAAGPPVLPHSPCRSSIHSCSPARLIAHGSFLRRERKGSLSADEKNTTLLTWPIIFYALDIYHGWKNVLDKHSASWLRRSLESFSGLKVCFWSSQRALKGKEGKNSRFRKISKQMKAVQIS